MVVFPPTSTNEIFRTYTLGIGTEYLAHLVSEAVLESQLRSSHRRLMEVPPLHCAAGSAFERLVYDCVPVDVGGRSAWGMHWSEAECLSLTFTCTGTEGFNSLAELR